MEIKTRFNHAKAFASLLTFSLLFSGIQSAQATLLNISQKPLVLSDSVAPNLILTLDDSGSMRFGFVPDAIGRETQGHRNYRRTKSAAFNAMYYDPAIAYQLPLKINSDGSQASPGYTTSFTSAWNNGFDTSKGSINLTNSFQVPWDVPIVTAPSNYSYANTSNYTGSGIIYRLAENPESDFSGTAVIGKNNGTGTSSGDIVFSIRRTGNSSCTATASYASTFNNLPADCSRTASNTYTATLTQKSVPAYYYTPKPNCTNKENDDCYQLRFVGEAERQNFAIWYSFYRNRALATLSAANLSFNQLPNSVRLTWQTLNSCKSLNSSASGCGVNYFRTFAGQHRGNFFSWLSGVSFDSGTALREALGRAGEFLRTDDAWAHTPNPFTSTGGRGTTDNRLDKYSCRPSYHIMMTDGMWNGADGSPSTTLRPDHAGVILPDGKSYTGQHPFVDSTRNTLADMAFHYWATDASGLANNVRPYAPFASKSGALTDAEYWDPRNDPATWQHMTNYMVGLGLTSALSRNGLEWDSELGTFGGRGYENFKKGTAWPQAVADSTDTVYDLWHAAINSRGEFFSVEDPDSMVSAFKKIIDRIGNFTTSASRPAVTASQVDGSTSREVYETEFSSDDWSGDLKKYAIGTTGSRTLSWSAKAQLTSARTVKMAAANGKELQNFSWTNLTTTQKNFFQANPDSSNNQTDNRGEARVDYIRGDRSNEGTSPGTFRTRSSVLGDIVNSAPAVVKGGQYLAYLADRVDGASGDYLKFQLEAAKRKEMIYVGANDGMLHGFNAATGKEEFAFVPNAVLPNLHRLTGQTYQSGGHRYYVDGSPVVSDVYFNGAWHTVLIGSLRGGGRSLFALDITDPTNVKPMWEFTHENMGYSFPQPTVARLHTGKWAVVTGNGYGNQSGAAADKAALFVIDIQTGALVREVIVDGDTTKANGLSSVRLADNDSDGIADYAYAGDLQGNLWRFDLFRAKNTTLPTGNPFATSVIGTAQPGDITTSYGGKPLFKAVDGATGVAQPITAAPSLVRHPTQRGYLVMFGTGKYFEDSDGNVNTTLGHSVYAIWDRKTKAEITTTPPAITRGKLLAQTITQELLTDFNGVKSESRLVSQNEPKWYRDGTTTQTDNDVNHWGWSLELQVGNTKAGEMVINPMAARGEALILSTLTPNDDPCKDGVEAWLYGINPSSGGRTLFSVFDMDGSGDVNSGDTHNGNVISSRKLSSSSGFNLSGDTLFSTGESIKVNYGPTSSGRQSWQVIPKRSKPLEPVGNSDEDED